MGVVNLTGDALVAVTPSDTANAGDPASKAYGGYFIGLMVWKAGTVSLIDAAGNASGVSDSLPAGTIIPGKVYQVKSTGTSATLLGIIGVA